jgi:hypothetical protein
MFQPILTNPGSPGLRLWHRFPWYRTCSEVGLTGLKMTYNPYPMNAEEENMANIRCRRLGSGQYLAIGLLIIISILWFNRNITYAHGGKKHQENAFTALQALQKAVAVYDKLIAAGKLEESWEIGLWKVEVVTRKKNGKLEYRISFQRSEGTPNAVYIFYSENGAYAGSNFEGS